MSADDEFLSAYSRLPAYSKQDYADAGASVMPADIAPKVDELELQFEGRPFQTLKQLRGGDFIMPMATGGSSSLPLKVHMTKHHMFSNAVHFLQVLVSNGLAPG